MRHRPSRSTLFPYTTLFRSLGNRFHGFLHLRIGFQQNLEAFLLVERRHEHFLLDLPLDPVEAFGHFWLRVPDTVLAQILAEDARSEEHTSELQSRFDIVCRL